MGIPETDLNDFAIRVCMNPGNSFTDPEQVIAWAYEKELVCDGKEMAAETRRNLTKFLGKFSNEEADALRVKHGL